MTKEEMCQIIRQYTYATQLRNDSFPFAEVEWDVAGIEDAVDIIEKRLYEEATHFQRFNTQDLQRR